MILGIDIDGTVNNFQDVVAKYLQKEYDIKFDDKDYELYKGLNKSEIDKFNDKYSQVFLKEVKALPESQEVINELMNKGNEVYFITAREYSHASDTMEWLKRNNFSFTDIYFNCGNKVDTCKWKNVDIMIDDSPYNLKALNKAGIPYIIYNQNYNQDIYNELYRASNWNNIYDFLTYMKE